MNTRNVATEFIARGLRIARLILIGCMIVYVVGLAIYLLLRLLFGDSLWWVGLINTFALYTFLPLIVVLPLVLLLRQRVLSFVALALTLIGLIWFGRYYLPKGSVSASGPTLKVISFNTMNENQHLDAVFSWVRQQAPDIVLFQEFPHQAEVDSLHDLYPYQFVQPHLWGNLILSRFPLKSVEDIPISDEPATGLQRVTLDFNGQTLAVYDVHLLDPFRKTPRFQVSDEQSLLLRALLTYDDTVRGGQIDTLVAHVKNETGPFVVAGDFNTSDQSVIYNILAAQMTDTFRERGTGLGLSWPVAQGPQIPTFVPAIIRIDYIWHSSAFQAVQVQQGPTNLGSDHIPLVAVLAPTGSPVQ